MHIVLLISHIQLSFENLLKVVESAVQSTDTRRSVNFSNSIIEHCIGGLWDNPQYEQEWNNSLQRQDKLYYYLQKDSLGMGLPLAPTFVNMFLSHPEERWLSNCPTDFKPELYRRYVDDVSVIFNYVSSAEIFRIYELYACYHESHF